MFVYIKYAILLNTATLLSFALEVTHYHNSGPGGGGLGVGTPLYKPYRFVPPRVFARGGGGGSPIHYLYGYVPPIRVVILKLLI